jgi:hypothetical protein
LPEPFELIHDFLSNISFTLIFDRTSDVILVAVHRRLFPAHPGLDEKGQERRARVLVIDPGRRPAVPRRELW